MSTTITEIKKVRSSNFELLRIVSILLILSMHIYHQGVSGANNVSILNQYLGLVINAIGNVGVSCFVIISGYFGVKFRKERFCQIILLTTLYSIIVSLLNNPSDIKSILTSALTVPFHTSWFIACYLMLMLLSPIINVGLTALSKETFSKILLAQFVFYCLFVFIQPHEMKVLINSGGKCFAYFIFLYMTGRFIRMHYDVIIKRYKLISLWLIMTIFASIVTICAGKVLGMGLGFPKALVDCSPFMYISSICVFFLFKGMNFQSNEVNVISSATLSIYLLEGSRIWVDRTFVNLSQYGGGQCVCLISNFNRCINLPIRFFG